MRIFAWVAALGNSLANSTLGNAFIMLVEAIEDPTVLMDEPEGDRDQ